MPGSHEAKRVLECRRRPVREAGRVVGDEGGTIPMVIGTWRGPETAPRTATISAPIPKDPFLFPTSDLAPRCNLRRSLRGPST